MKYINIYYAFYMIFEIENKAEIEKSIKKIISKFRLYYAFDSRLFSTKPSLWKYVFHFVTEKKIKP
jgi:hypothetical protein